MLKMNLQTFAAKPETDPPEPAEPPKEDNKLWQKALTTLEQLGERLTKLETEKATEKPTITIPVPAPAKPAAPAPGEPAAAPAAQTQPAKKSLLSYLW